MVFSLFSRSSKIVNLVLNDHSIRYVVLKQKHPVIPLQYGQRYLPPGIISDGKIQDFATLETILEECIEDWKIARREIRFIVPDSLVIIRKVSIPADIKDDEIHGYLYLELGSTIHLPFDEPVFDTIVLDRTGGKQEVLLFAAPEKFVSEYADLFKSVKLKAIAADISPLALFRLYVQQNEITEEDTVLTVRFDVDMVSMCVFEGHIPVFMRHLPAELKESWSIKYGRSTETDGELAYEGDPSELMFQFDDVYREIAKLMDFYRYSMAQDKNEVRRIVLDGDHPMMERIHKDIEDRFGIPVDSITIHLQGNDHGVLPGRYNLGLGLGLKEVQ